MLCLWLLIIKMTLFHDTHSFHYVSPFICDVGLQGPELEPLTFSLQEWLYYLSHITCILGFSGDTFVRCKIHICVCLLHHRGTESFWGSFGSWRSNTLRDLQRVWGVHHQKPKPRGIPRHDWSFWILLQRHPAVSLCAVVAGAHDSIDALVELLKEMSVCALCCRAIMEHKELLKVPWDWQIGEREHKHRVQE